MNVRSPRWKGRTFSARAADSESDQDNRLSSAFEIACSKYAMSVRFARNSDEHVEAKLLPFCKQPLRDVLMIMRDAGIRNQKEVFTMRWEHLDWSQSRYFVYDSKTPKGRRHVPISPRVLQALLARYSDQKQGWVFPSKRAKCGHLTTVARQFHDARKDAGLPDDLVLYCAHHGFGTEMYRATKNLFAVMKVMGHAAVATTMKYQHQDIDEIAHVASQRVQ
jgi:integrase